MKQKSGYEIALDMFALRSFARQNAEDFDKRHIMRALSVAIEEMLTDAQRNYVLDRYGNNLTLEEIGMKYGVCPSSVSKTIKRARINLWSVMRFTCPAFLETDISGRN